jgi:hypothetical protein
MKIESGVVITTAVALLSRALAAPTRTVSDNLPEKKDAVLAEFQSGGPPAVPDMDKRDSKGVNPNKISVTARAPELEEELDYLAARAEE